MKRIDRDSGSNPGILTSLIFFTVFFSVAMLADFVLTPNPYAAFHSFTLPGSTVEATYFVAPVYLLLATGVVVFARQRRIGFMPEAVLLAALLSISAFTLDLWVPMFRTYASFATLILMTASFAALEARSHFAHRDIPRLRAFVRWLSLLIAIGLMLAIAFDGRYGRVPFEFSRISRGEVTLWNLTGLLVLFPTMALVAHRQLRIRYPLVLLFIMTIVIASTVTRAAVLTVTLPVLIHLIFRLQSTMRMLVLLTTAGALLFSWRSLIESFATVGGNTLEDATSGRSSLWQFHAETFLDNWLFGAGQLIAVRSSETTGEASVETGLLAWFSENGVLFGALGSFLVIRAALAAIRLLRAGDQTGHMSYAVSIVALTLIPSLLERFSRILTIEDFIFWFAIFYLNAHRRLTLGREMNVGGHEKLSGDGHEPARGAVTRTAH